MNKEEWEKIEADFDSTFDYLNARHTNEQWDSYKNFWRPKIEEAYQRGYAEGCSNPNYNDGLEAGYQAGMEAIKKAAIEAVPKRSKGMDEKNNWTLTDEEADGFNECREQTLTALQSLPITDIKK